MKDKGKCLREQKAFTLVELLIVIAVLGIIVGISVPRFSGLLGSVRENADVSSAFLWISSIETELITGGLNTVGSSLTISESESNGFDGNIQKMISKPSQPMLAIITPEGDHFKITVYPGDSSKPALAEKEVSGPIK